MPPADIEKMRRLVAQKVELETRLVSLEAEIDAAEALVEKLRRASSADAEDLARVDSRLNAAEEATRGQLPVPLSIIGKLVRLDARGRMFLHGMALVAGGSDRAPGVTVIPVGMVLYDPNAADLARARVGFVQASNVYFRGRVDGVNDFGGPATLWIYAHEVPPLSKQQVAAAALVQRLQRERGSLAARLRPLEAAKQKLNRLREQQDDCHAELAKLMQEAAPAN